MAAIMEYPIPNNPNSTVFNDLNQQSNIEQAVSGIDSAELLQYVRKAGDSMQGNLRAPELTLYGESSKLTFHDGSYMTTASGAAANEQKLTDITYNSGTSTTTIANNTHLDNLTAGNINTSHLSGTTSNLQSQIDSTVNNTSTNSSDISALQSLTSQHTTDISQNAADIVTNNDNISIIETNVNTNTSDISSLTSTVNTNTSNIATSTSAISAIQSVNTTQTNDINAIKTKTDKITITAVQDVNIQGSGNTIFQCGNINDINDGDDNSQTVSCGTYTGGGVGVGPGYTPANLRGIAGAILSSFLVAARANEDSEGLILSGDIARSSIEAGPHLFINRKGLISIGSNCLTKSIPKALN